MTAIQRIYLDMLPKNECTNKDRIFSHSKTNKLPAFGAWG
jgi:hypothetical protein